MTDCFGQSYKDKENIKDNTNFPEKDSAPQEKSSVPETGAVPVNKIPITASFAYSLALTSDGSVYL
ncbi:MAG: hypothetical protein BSOLF_2754 [Candidatus Carbobacillus altaicus]|uniref:Uncharacterized protein n=1 Tax=Candidatus Carbonibacillus altaicus TaxID=2163959 RepID=A0A2R6Y223_9BACL|nr:MAG: hypothetical protein BSOLF_2754 [Candidatus Carbobacillus altaicus]